MSDQNYRYKSVTNGEAFYYSTDTATGHTCRDDLPCEVTIVTWDSDDD